MKRGVPGFISKINMGTINETWEVYGVKNPQNTENWEISYTLSRESLGAHEDIKPGIHEFLSTVLAPKRGPILKRICTFFKQRFNPNASVSPQFSDQELGQSQSVRWPQAEENIPAQLVGLEVGALNEIHLKEKFLPKNTTGVILIKVEPNSPAARSGIESGDIVQSISRNKLGEKRTELIRQDVESLYDFSSFAKEIEEDEIVNLLIVRGKQSLFIAIDLKMLNSF